jgi:hypothetical protein
LTSSILQGSGTNINLSKQHSKDKKDKQEELNNKALGKLVLILAFKTTAKIINQTNTDLTKTNFKLKNSLNSIINFDKNQTRDYYETKGIEDILNPTPDNKQKRSVQMFSRQPSSSKDTPTKDIKNLVLQKVSQIANINAEKEKLKDEVNECKLDKKLADRE